MSKPALKIYKITDFSSSKDKVLCDWYLYSSDHLEAAEYLLNSNNPIFDDSAALLTHYAFELLFKTCLLYTSQQFEEEHDLLKLVHQIGFLNLSIAEQNLLTEINGFFYNRYPLDSTTNKKKNSQKSNNSLLCQAGEVGTETLEKTIELYSRIEHGLPGDLQLILKKSDPYKKGNRVLMIKKKKQQVTDSMLKQLKRD